MKRALSTGQAPAPTDLPSESSWPEDLFPDFSDEETQSEPVLSNHTSLDPSMLMDAEFNELSISTGEHTAPEKSDRSRRASSEAASANADDEIAAMKKAALSGDAEAQCELGASYDKGDGVKENKEKAFKWYCRAAEQGHTVAQFQVGTMYSNGEGVEVDKEKAFTWIHEAADQGHMFSQWIVGSAYDTGVGVEKNKEKAFRYFYKAAEQGLSKAQSVVGIMYDEGDGVEVDEKKAFMWSHTAAVQGDTVAKFKVALMYYQGRGVEKNNEKAFASYQELALQGQAVAQANLGVMYDRGHGVDVNKGEAFEWFKKAAAQGDEEAQFNLGVAYAEGKGVKANKEKAFEWFCKAAEQGNHKAQLRVSECYQKGIGVTKDLPLSAYWLLKSQLSAIDTSSVVSLDYHYELIKLFPGILEKYSELKNLNRINFYSDKEFFGDEEIATIVGFIRSNSNVTDLKINSPLSVCKIDLSALVEALKFNTQLTDLEFSHMSLPMEMNSVREGMSLARALSVHPHFPPMLIHMIRAGEVTGELPVMLNRAAQMQEQDLERRALTMASLLEPVLILTMGVVVLLIVLAVLMPIIEINQLVK